MKVINWNGELVEFDLFSTNNRVLKSSYIIESVYSKAELNNNKTIYKLLEYIEELSANGNIDNKKNFLIKELLIERFNGNYDKFNKIKNTTKD